MTRAEERQADHEAEPPTQKEEVSERRAESIVKQREGVKPPERHSRRSDDVSDEHADGVAHTDGDRPRSEEGSEEESTDSGRDEPVGTNKNSDEDYDRPGSRIDRWWGRVLSTARRQRLWFWGGPVAVAILAAVVRLVHLGSPDSLVFDETFYVKDAYTLLNNGYESQWTGDADSRFSEGHPSGFTTDPLYVVHPPLGKWLISLGLSVFGAGDPVGWRISTAVAGILAVIVLMFVTHRLTKSTVLTVIAGSLFAIDGNAIVMSRVSLLDNFLMLFALLGFAAVLLDRESHVARLATRIRDSSTGKKGNEWGPIIVWRPWLVAAGFFFGCACAVKWSGIFFLAAFGLYLVLVDMVARRRLGVAFWASSGILRQGPVTFLLFVPIAFVTYIASWTGWLVTQGGMFRSWATTDGLPWTDGLSWVPLWFQNLWHYHATAYAYHIGLTTPHPYQADPFTWLLMLRPTNMYFEASTSGENGCTFDNCASQITGLGNPLIWWAATAALVYVLYRFVARREWRNGLILMGIVAGYLPWLAYVSRTIFQFYSIAFEPYMILALAIVIGIILGKRDDPYWKRTRGVGVIAVYLTFVTLVSIFFWPLWTAEQIPFWYWESHIWLPTWR